MALVGVELETLVFEPDELNNVQNRDRKLTLLVIFMQVSSLWLAFIVFEIGQNLHKIR